MIRYTLDREGAIRYLGLSSVVAEMMAYSDLVEALREHEASDVDGEDTGSGE